MYRAEVISYFINLFSSSPIKFSVPDFINFAFWKNQDWLPLFTGHFSSFRRRGARIKTVSRHRNQHQSSTDRHQLSGQYCGVLSQGNIRGFKDEEISFIRYMCRPWMPIFIRQYTNTFSLKSIKTRLKTNLYDEKQLKWCFDLKLFRQITNNEAMSGISAKISHSNKFLHIEKYSFSAAKAFYFIFTNLANINSQRFAEANAEDLSSDVSEP